MKKQARLEKTEIEFGRELEICSIVPDIVYRIDIEGRFTFLNDAVGSLGYCPEELIGQPFAEIVLPDDVEEVSRRFVLPRFTDKSTGEEGAPKLFDERRTGSRKTMALEVRLVSKRADRIVPAELYSSGQPVLNVELNSSGLYSSVEGRPPTFETGNVAFDEAYCAAHPGFSSGEYALLSVSDNGCCGMDKETIGKIFEPFFITKKVSQGTGLGLAMIYGIVKQNNGFINVYSEPDQGTTFKIYLRRHAAKTEQIREKSPTKSIARGHETILLVEEEPVILKMTTMMLERQGYRVLAASTPSEAIRVAKEHAGEIHLLLVDVIMPEMNGRDLAKNLGSLYQDLKYLFMSGYTANVIIHHGVFNEREHFIQKPFSKQDLAAKVREALDGIGYGENGVRCEVKP